MNFLKKIKKIWSPKAYFLDLFYNKAENTRQLSIKNTEFLNINKNMSI